MGLLVAVHGIPSVAHGRCVVSSGGTCSDTWFSSGGRELLVVFKWV